MSGLHLSSKNWFWIAITLGVFVLWGVFSPVLAPFIVGLIVAYLFDPLVERLVKYRVSRPLSCALIVILFVVLFFGGLLLLMPILAADLLQLALTAPRKLIGLTEWMDQYVPGFSEHLEVLSGPDWSSVIGSHISGAFTVSAGVLGGLLSGSQAAFSVFTFLGLMPIVAYFTMKEWPHIMAAFQNLLPRETLPAAMRIARKMDERISGFIRGQVIVAAMLGVYYAVALTLIGLPYGLLVGVITGVLSVMPLVGSVFGLLSSVVIALFQVPDQGWGLVLTTTVVFVLGQVVEGNFITPKIVGDRVGLHPLWIILALLVGGHLMGLVGMMVAVPLAAVVAVLVEEFLARYKSSALYHTKP